MSSLASQLFAAIYQKTSLEDLFSSSTLEIFGIDKDAGWPFAEFDFDPYDSSFELHGCQESLTLTAEQRDKFWELGFSRCWLNYANGTERHYWHGDSCPEYQGLLKRKSDCEYLEQPQKPETLSA